jgi:hypothetical protein
MPKAENRSWLPKNRWLDTGSPELEQRMRRHLKPTNKSWRVDETYVRVKGRWSGGRPHYDLALGAAVWLTLSNVFRINGRRVGG